MVSQQETVDTQETKVPEYMWSWGTWVWGGCCVHVWAMNIGTGRGQSVERYLGCHIHVDTLVSRRIQPETGGWGCDNQWTCVHVWVSIIGTGRGQSVESYLDCHIHVDTLVSRRIDCHIHVDTLVSRRIHGEAGGWGCDNQWTCTHVWVRSVGIMMDTCYSTVKFNVMGTWSGVD
jgi:hypothetical protein